MRGVLPFGSGRPRSLFVCARSDPAAFADLYVAYHPQVLRYLARQTLDPEVAFDLMAETFAQMFAGLDGFRGTSEAEGLAWMWAIARHELYRWRDRRRVERTYVAYLGVPLHELGPQEYERIEELADLERFRPVLEQSLAALPEDTRRVLQLRVVEHRPYEEIGELLGASAGAIRIRVSRALRELAGVLERAGHLDEG
ncbi:MAG: polymerase, sigma-24 subunit, subfamily [Conexibacter sp.]|nr:polymerase, sigma-24 subunit, subfamily [Conexibacter sp.]